MFRFILVFVMTFVAVAVYSSEAGIHSLAAASAAVPPSNIDILINGEEIEFVYRPLVEGGEVLVDIGPVADFFGAEVRWDLGGGVAEIVNGDISITIAADCFGIVWRCGRTGHQEVFEMHVPSRIHNNVLFVPAEVLVDALDFTIDSVTDFAPSFGWNREALGRAVSSYETALFLAEHGFVHSQAQVAVFYENGWMGAPRNFERAAYWYTHAAQQGNVAAQNNLGLMYRFGRGVPQDYERALHWFRIAAVMNGCPSAEFNLGLAYLLGEGIEVDYARAFYWTARAAKQGL